MIHKKIFWLLIFCNSLKTADVTVASFKALHYHDRCDALHALAINCVDEFAATVSAPYFNLALLHGQEFILFLNQRFTTLSEQSTNPLEKILDSFTSSSFGHRDFDNNFSHMRVSNLANTINALSAEDEYLQQKFISIARHLMCLHRYAHEIAQHIDDSPEHEKMLAPEIYHAIHACLAIQDQALRAKEDLLFQKCQPEQSSKMQSKNKKRTCLIQ